MIKFKGLFAVPIPENRIFGLDALRALAALVVVFQHGAWLVPRRIPHWIKSTELDGVTLFFVLSGFLIGRILLDEITGKEFSLTSLVSFWMRRWLRTLPLYYSVLIFALLTYSIFGYPINRAEVPKYFFFIQNLASPHPGFFSVAWSLAVEEWFYLLFPLLVFITTRFQMWSRRHNFLAVAICFLLFSIAFRWWRFSCVGEGGEIHWDQDFRMQVFTRFDSILLGVLGAYCSKFFSQIWDDWKWKSLTIGVVILLCTTIAKTVSVYAFTGLYGCVVSFLLESIGVLLLFPVLSVWKIKRHNYLTKLIVRISLISYSLYLLHHTVVQVLLITSFNWEVIVPIKDLNIVIRYVAYWFFTVILSITSYKYIEKTALSYRDRNWKSSK